MPKRLQFRPTHVTAIALAVVAFTVLATCTARVFAQKPPLTGCSVRAFIERAPKPGFVNEDTRARISATYVKPTSTAECDIDNPVWSWAFDMMNPVERKNPVTGMWEADPYRPTIYHISPSGPEAILTARFPRAGQWRVNLVVTATWNSRECTSCTDDDKLVVNFPDVTDCSFTGVLVSEDNFFGRSTTRVGVKEPGKLEVRLAPGTVLADVAPLSWTPRSGANRFDFFDNGDGTAKCDALLETGPGVFELRSGKTGCTATVTIDIVAPTGVEHTYKAAGTPSGISGGQVSFHIKNTVHLFPKDVSFHYITVGEGTCAAEVTGEFKVATGGTDPHQENSGAVTNGHYALGSRWTEPDICGFSGLRVNKDAGHHIWIIPQQWHNLIGGQSFCTLEQRMDFDGKQKIRIQKGGVDRSGP